MPSRCAQISYAFTLALPCAPIAACSTIDGDGTTDGPDALIKVLDAPTDCATPVTFEAPPREILPMTMLRLRPGCRPWPLAAALAAAACAGEPTAGDLDPDEQSEPPPEPDARGTYLDVFLGPGARICGPTLERLDAEVERVADALGVALDPEQRITLHYGDVPVKERCGIEAEVGTFMWGGCTDRDGLWIAAQPGAEVHEIVHALRLRDDVFGTQYWEEGLATKHVVA